MRRKSQHLRGAPADHGELITYLRGCRCVLCRAANAKYNRELRAARGKNYTRQCNLRQAHGLDLNDYNKLLVQQNGVCAACKAYETGKNQYGLLPLAVDHDHKTKKIRGLLCMRCNRALGLLKDSSDVLQALLRYRRKSIRLYIGGPMRQIENFNFHAFDKATTLGRSLGYTVISPAEHDREIGFDPTSCSPHDDSWTQHLDLKDTVAWDLDQLRGCDAIALLPGWENSLGAQAEFAVAKWLGLDMLDALTFERLKVK